MLHYFGKDRSHIHLCLQKETRHLNNDGKETTKRVYVERRLVAKAPQLEESMFSLCERRVIGQIKSRTG